MIQKSYGLEFPVFTDDFFNDIFNDFKIFRMQAQLLHHLGVFKFIGLYTHVPDARAFGRIEHLELQGRLVGDLGHDSAQSVDLPNDDSLGRSAHRWIARHLGDMIQFDRD